MDDYLTRNRLYVRKDHILAILLTLSTLSAAAQHSSKGNLFEVDWLRGCPGATVHITINNPSCDCTASCSCNYAPESTMLPVGENDFTTFKFQHTYTDPGEYYLVVLMDDTQDSIKLTIEDLPPPEYEVMACAGEEVRVVLDDDTYDQYAIDFGDGTRVTVNQGDPVPDHTYADGAAKSISVRGLNANSANNCSVTTTTFTPLTTLPAPTITRVTALDESHLALAYDTRPFIRYELYMSTDGNIPALTTTFSGAIPGDTINGLDLTGHYYCFQLIATDPCGGMDNYSNNACSIQLGATQGDGAIALDWTTAGNSSEFSVLRDDQEITTTPVNVQQYSDSTGSCGATYCYKVEASFYGAVSTSLPVCKEFQRTSPPAPITDLSLEVIGKDVRISWYPDDPSGYQYYDLYRTGPTQQPEKITQVTATSYTDPGLDIPGLTNYCYEVVPTDNCDNRNPENQRACVMQLRGDINLRDEVTVIWNSYAGYGTGLDHYSVEVGDGAGGYTEAGQTNDTTFTFADTDPQLQQLPIRVMAYAADGTVGTSVSNVILLYKTTNLIYPEAFTPDGDGLNDAFEVKGRYISTFELQIFNRWGEMIYTTNDLSASWDGTIRGKEAPAGVYAGKLRITDESGRDMVRELSIVLVRH